MFDAEFEHPVYRTAERIAAESRHAEDQIDGQVFETGLAGVSDRFCGLGGGMAAVHQPQAGVVERLDADRQTVDTGASQRLEIVGRQVVGIGLEGGLLDLRAVEELRGVVQEPFQRLGRTERRSSAAEIAGPDGFLTEVVATGLHFAVHGLDERGHAAGSDLLEEVAVGAYALAEGDMKVESGHNKPKLQKFSAWETFFEMKLFFG